MTPALPGLRDPEIARAATTLWNYHRLQHDLHPTDVGIGLGSHDLSVATTAAELYQRQQFPLIVFTGANAPTTIDRFPRGEAVHYREHALGLGVPDASILVEPAARNTAENMTLSQDLLAATGHVVRTVTLISRPYQQRRAYATCRKVWPEVEPICTSTTLPFEAYVKSIGDEAQVLNVMVGDTQRIELYAELGYSIPQDVPDDVRRAMKILADAGYNTQLV